MSKQKVSGNTIEQNPFEFSDDNKRYHTFNYFLRHRFGGKVFKVSLNAGLGCPNRDGAKGIGGCTYCSELASGDFAGSSADSITKQFDDIREKMHRKWEQGRYIPYFQAGTNTYADTGTLREIYYEALAQPDVVGLSIATRADCITDETLLLLEEISRKTYLVVELGLQTVFDETAKRINRGHTYADFLSCYKRLEEKGINICAHLIDGLPGETREMMIETARKVGELCPHEVKLHLLHILKNTQMEKEYARGMIAPLELDEYVSIICDQLEVLPPQTIIGRITGDGAKSDLIAPLWSIKKFCVINEIDKEMARRNSWQGKKAMHNAQCTIHN